ncbi:LysR family transcriptional regulator [Vibrio viridaestus]|uniref:LysR family transcriptional regulator n=1 Tax=Vibrio viridaestus TaxID=2487322 RepID=A0A3N9TB32_9VIBR|nr:LysR family transcriptional regulator [Vibrio viridaestus]RQW61368.1 LysR family transcriptional regulator [Vibrio viridaestus]
MDLKQIHYFHAIAVARSFSAAARAIHIAQPALTRQIKLLEEDIGCPLFLRHSSGVELTPAGEIFLQDTQDVLAQLDKAKNKAKKVGQGLEGQLSIGVTVMILWLEQINQLLKRYRKAFPAVMLDVDTLLSGPQLDAILKGRLDAGILMLPPALPELNSMILYEDSLALVVPSDSPLLEQKPRYLRDIQDWGFIWFEREKSPIFHDQLLQFFAQRRLEPRIIEKGSDAITMLSLVASGVGCTIVPRTVLKGLPSGLSIIELEDLNLPINIELVWRKDSQSAVLEHFIEIAKGA